MSEERRIDVSNLQVRDILKEDNDRLNSLVAEMSMLLGKLRGIMFNHEVYCNSEQREQLKKIDENIERIFYKGEFKVGLLK